MRRLVPIVIALSALTLAACGSEGVSVPEDEATASAGAEIFATHCSGCHTLSAAGSQGSGNRGLRAQGPNFDQRVESSDDVLYAIRNGGFSGAIMPQNIVVGDDAELVADFLTEYSGSDVDDPVRPSPAGGTEAEASEPSASPEGVSSEDSTGAGAPAGGSAPEGGGAPAGGASAGGGAPAGGGSAAPAPAPGAGSQGQGGGQASGSGPSQPGSN